MSEEMKPSYAQMIANRKTAIDLNTGRPLDVLPNRSATFIVDHTVCKPGAFSEDFELTLRSLSPADEIRAAQRAKGDSYSMAVGMACASLYAVNGAPLDKGKLEHEQLWNDLDQAGRNLVIGMWSEIGSAGDEAAGKAQASLIVE